MDYKEWLDANPGMKDQVLAINNARAMQLFRALWNAGYAEGRIDAIGRSRKEKV